MAEPAAANRTDSASIPAKGSQRPTDAQRSAALRRSVAELTREWRASVRRSGEFDALLVRGTPRS